MEHDFYQILGIDSKNPQTFENGFRFKRTPKASLSDTIKACMKKRDIVAEIKNETGLTVKEFIEMIWMLIERPNAEFVYRIGGLQALERIDLHINPDLLQRVKKRVEKHRTRLGNRSNSSNESI